MNSTDTDGKQIGAKNRATQEARARRLQDMRCPLHGLPLGQVEGWMYRVDGSLHECPTCGCCCHGEYSIAACSRKDCAVRVTARGADEVGQLISPAWLVAEMAAAAGIILCT
jgi:hypothetical protein